MHTVVGELMHKKAHDPYLSEKRKDVLVAGRCLYPPKSWALAVNVMSSNFTGKRTGFNYMDTGACIVFILLNIRKGKPKSTEEDVFQLAAQAMCLEEMFSTTVPEGALFYGETRRREI